MPLDLYPAACFFPGICRRGRARKGGKPPIKAPFLYPGLFYGRAKFDRRVLGVSASVSDRGAAPWPGCMNRDSILWLI
ncbi:MAG: hypothetical protein A2W25_02325 [candidate division Zixibacteria bacterium RBG_16_53_22]|nr:MAG: hypothetical protein A2W25_02325 [candidate division Zixibacteria bacterium RBG_16_53_22]